MILFWICIITIYISGFLSVIYTWKELKDLKLVILILFILIYGTILIYIDYLIIIY